MEFSKDLSPSGKYLEDLRIRQVKAQSSESFGESRNCKERIKRWESISKGNEYILEYEKKLAEAYADLGRLQDEYYEKMNSTLRIVRGH